MIKAILFDWHGVLDRTVITEFIDILASKSRFSPEKIKEIITPYEKLKIIGKITLDEYIDNVVDEADMKVEDVKSAFNYVLQVEKNDELWQLIPKLRKMYKLAIVSESWPEKVDVIKHKFTLDHFFDAALFSSDVKTTKNKPQIYMLACELLNVTPIESLFVDDNLGNVSFAKTLGFNTCLFESIVDLNPYIERSY